LGNPRRLRRQDWETPTITRGKVERTKRRDGTDTLTNAYRPDGGTIRLTARRAKRPERDRLAPRFWRFEMVA
jgi:hypothetical protein